jgi:predicted lysophospholipase L1 biosynthesis ABC-type transport system permease subunit
VTSPEDLRRGTVGPTRIRSLFGLFIVGGVLGYGFERISVAVNGVAPQVQWSSVVVLLAAAAIVLVLANSTFRTLHRERRVMDVHRAVRFLLLAKASALVGAIVAGAYLGFALHFVDQLDVPLPQTRVIRSVCAAIAAVLLVVGGLLLERACRIPKDRDE